jgi:hypothetical protein
VPISCPIPLCKAKVCVDWRDQPKSDLTFTSSLQLTKLNLGNHMIDQSDSHRTLLDKIRPPIDVSAQYFVKQDFAFLLPPASVGPTAQQEIDESWRYDLAKSELFVGAFRFDFWFRVTGSGTLKADVTLDDDRISHIRMKMSFQVKGTVGCWSQRTFAAQEPATRSGGFFCPLLNAFLEIVGGRSDYLTQTLRGHKHVVLEVRAYVGEVLFEECDKGPSDHHHNFDHEGKESGLEHVGRLSLLSESGRSDVLFFRV